MTKYINPQVAVAVLIYGLDWFAPEEQQHHLLLGVLALLIAAGDLSILLAEIRDRMQDGARR